MLMRTMVQLNIKTIQSKKKLLFTFIIKGNFNLMKAQLIKAC